MGSSDSKEERLQPSGLDNAAGATNTGGSIMPAHVKNKAHPDVGINAKRGCTDCLVMILFFLCWGVMGWVANLALTNGEPKRLVLGSDYLGNLCGVPGDDAPNVPDWADRKLLWYPITYDYNQNKLLIREALKLGVCVAECPDPARSLLQTVYTTGNSSANTPPPWPVLFKSSPTFHRCLPDFFSFNCQGSPDCEAKKKLANLTFERSTVLTDVAQKGFDEVANSWWIIMCSVGIVIVLSFIWLLILRRLVKPMVVITVILVLLALIGVGVLFWLMKTHQESKEPPNEKAAKWFLAGAIISWIIAFIYLCVLIFIWKDIMIACDIIEEATKIPISIPSMLLVPPITFQFIIPFLIFFLAIAVYIQSSGDRIQVTLPTPSFINNNQSDIASSIATQVSTFRNMSLNNTLIDSKEYTFSNWRIYAHFYNLFMFLWSFGFINAICFMILAFCANFWYWSAPGDNKDPPNFSVCIGAKFCLCNHVGTLAFGSLIVAIVQVMRIALAVFEKHMSEFVETHEAIGFLFKVVHCILGCLERCIKFINKNAYIITAMTSKNFISAAREAVELLLANVLSVGAVTVIGEYVMTFGKVLVTLLTTFLTWLIMDASGQTDGISGGALVLLIVIVIAYFISCLFTQVFSVCIDSVLLCFCYDKAHPTYDYFPADLAANVERAKERKMANSKKGPQQQQDGNTQEMQAPLKSNPIGGGHVDEGLL